VHSTDEVCYVRLPCLFCLIDTPDFVIDIYNSYASYEPVISMQVGLPNAVPPQAFSPSFHSSAVVLKLLATKSCSFHEITASFLTENVLDV